ncbi:pilus assembly protein PilM [Xenorhabdus sp. DI]|uniref:type IV pilus biogenesis protein PilM n=1 Tax=Xenorhabdus doucetiae TaxID=351671 RepID=UPI00198F7456|nr:MULTISPECIES: pilus assembly protein PilM [unclassified Xenorhabdus]MBD2784528.1 pilus assembly protein PilM [Xenorhabdus sp. 3]MBD2788375.1 pilus assembly protein PilM [Xenorhabdus sp. DI]MBD2796414.1 pilus assembly protein PilM [Xenorhabdus sp. 18]
MYPPKWYIGLDVQDHDIRALAAIKRRDGWQLRHCWQYRLSSETISGGRLQDPEKLLHILIQWRKILPKNLSLRFALPVQQTLQKQIALPGQTALQEPELGWFVHASAGKQFPVSDLALDYRVHGQQICISATRQKDLNLWLNLFSEINLSLDAIDIAPCALRYAAKLAGVPDDSWLVHKRMTDWLWVAPAGRSFSYGLIAAQPDRHLVQVINQLPITPETEGYTLYYSDEAQPTSIKAISVKTTSTPTLTSVSTESANIWQLLMAFRHYHPPLPDKMNAFIIAAGLALRPSDQ